MGAQPDASLDQFTFGDLLRAFRQRLRLRQAPFARAIGHSRTTISNWENGYMHPANREVLALIAKVLDLTPADTALLYAALDRVLTDEPARLRGAPAEAPAPAPALPLAPPEPYDTAVTFFWHHDSAGRGCFRDVSGKALIIGGSLQGGAAEGGEATWSQPLGPTPAWGALRVVILTNGERFIGKGLHSHLPEGTAEVWVNGAFVYHWVCTAEELYGDYWPPDALSLSPGLVSPWLPAVAVPLAESCTLRIVTSAYTCLDVNRVELRVRYATEPGAADA